MSKLDAISVFGTHVVAQYRAHLASHGGGAAPPLFVGMQGPQGSGKTTISRALVSYISSPPHGLRVAVLSTDDLYRTHEGLRAVAQAHPENRLLAGRGQPGTHDVPLGEHVLHQIAHINENNTPVHLPEFDKSLHAGEGDRAERTVEVQPPLDVFILDGWSMGFAPLTHDQVTQKFEKAPADSPLRQHQLPHLLQANENLKEYRDKWYARFNVFLQIKPTDLQNVYTWRLQQEHAMKAANGGKGMSDDQVKAFVDRYMPGYLLFLQTIRESPAWEGRGKAVVIDFSRACIEVEDF